MPFPRRDLWKPRENRATRRCPLGRKCSNPDIHHYESTKIMTNQTIEHRRGSLPGVFMRLPFSVLLTLVLLVPAFASPEKAARFYEDALGRYEKNDMPGAVIQLKNALKEDQKMLAAHLLLGKALFRNGDLKGAEAAFEEALKQGVNRGEVALPLGHVYLALGQPELVIDRITATGLPPALRVEVLTMRGTAYVESSNTRLAAESFKEARALDPKSASPLIAEIPMLIAAGQLDRAKENANKAVELAPNSADAWNMKASVLHASFDMASALLAYDQALSLDARHVDARVARAGLRIDLKHEADAKSDLEFLRTSAPDEPRAAYLRAVLAGQQRDGATVATELAQVTRTIDALPPFWLARREQLLMVGALAHHGSGNLQKARDYLNMIITRNARNLGAKKLLASIYLDTRDYGRALSLLESLQKATPEDPQVMFLLGSVYLAQRRYVQATELLEKAAARTGSAEMNRTLAFSELGLGRIEVGQATLEKAFAANPADSRAGTTLSMLYMRQGKAKRALQTAEAMVKREPANLTALNFLGTIRGATGDKAGARAAYTEVLAKDPDFRPAAMNLARLDISDRHFDEARARFNALLTKRADDPAVLFEYGLLEQRAGRLSEAIRYLQKASEVQRQDLRPALALIDIYLGQRQNELALDVAKTLALKRPDDLALQLSLARIYLASGDAANARTVLTGAARMADFETDTLVAIARMQLAAGHADGAAYSVQKALQGRPDDAAAMATLVEVEARRGDSAKADAALKALAAKHPDRVETALTTANLALSRGHYAAAIAAFRSALTRDESTGNALALAKAYLAAGDAVKATSALQAWVKAHPNDLTAQKALAETQFRAGHLAAARQNYAKVVAAQPDDAATLNNYANLLQQLNDPGAQEAAEKALKLSPGNPSYGDTLGWILVQKGQVDAGLRYLREARLRNPENGAIRFHLAYALSKNGRKAEATEELSAALTGPGRVTSSEAVNQLKKELGL